jgi:hypothetical protein
VAGHQQRGIAGHLPADDELLDISAERFFMEVDGRRRDVEALDDFLGVRLMLS